MLRIRFHGRGGQGIKTAGRILGTALFRQGFQVQDAPRYGAERRGAPTASFVRADRTPIRERGIIASPDLVCVADETLIGDPSAGVLGGLQGHAVLLVLSDIPATDWQKRLRIPGPVITLPATAPGAALGSLADRGARCAGATARLLGVVSREALMQAVRDELSSVHGACVEDEIRIAADAYDALAPQGGCVTQAAEAPAATDTNTRVRWIDLAFEEAERSAPAIHRPGTSACMKTGLWRQMRPVLDRTRCHRCVWVCGTYCPDSAIGVDEDGFPVIDYEHCKGCLICAAQCPAHAIEAVREHHDVVAG